MALYPLGRWPRARPSRKHALHSDAMTSAPFDVFNHAKPLQEERVLRYGKVRFSATPSPKYGRTKKPEPRHWHLFLAVGTEAWPLAPRPSRWHRGLAALDAQSSGPVVGEGPCLGLMTEGPSGGTTRAGSPTRSRESSWRWVYRSCSKHRRQLAVG